MNAECGDPKKVAANGGEPEEDFRQVNQGEKENEDGEIAIGRSIEKALDPGALRGMRAHSPKDDHAGEQGAEHRAHTEPQELGCAGRFGNTKSDAGKHRDVDDLIADEIDPFADRCFLKRDARDVTIDTVDDRGELQ